MEIHIFENQYFRDFDSEKRKRFVNCIVISRCSRAYIVAHVKNGSNPLDLSTLGEFNDLTNAEMFAKVYTDSLTQKSFNQVLHETFGFNKETFSPEQYEIYSTQYHQALRVYKELKPVNATVRGDIVDMIALSNRFQRQLTKFIEKNTHLIND